MTLKIRVTAEIYDDTSPATTLATEISDQPFKPFSNSLPGDNDKDIASKNECFDNSYDNFKHSILAFSNTSVVLDRFRAHSIQEKLKYGSITLKFDKEVNIAANITWSSNSNFIIESKHNITFGENVYINNYGNGSITLMAGIESSDLGATINFAATGGIISNGTGEVKLYYNPVKQAQYTVKYHSVIDHYKNVVSDSLKSYMWINTFEDLQNVQYFLHGHYALSRDIDLHGKKFIPITRISKPNHELIPFSGELDGNNKVIKNLNISFPNKNNVGLFSFCAGTEDNPVKIHNLFITSSAVSGHERVGIICGKAQYAEFYDIHLSDIKVTGDNLLGAVAGTAVVSNMTNLNISNNANTLYIAGGALHSSFHLSEEYKGHVVGQDAEMNEIVYA